MSSTLDPNDPPRPDEAESLPDEENISPGKVEEQIETEPEEARNYTDGYAPQDDHAEVIDADELESDGS